jgi:hypothetical protein
LKAGLDMRVKWYGRGYSVSGGIEEQKDDMFGTAKVWQMGKGSFVRVRYMKMVDVVSRGLLLLLFFVEGRKVLVFVWEISELTFDLTLGWDERDGVNDEMMKWIPILT